MLKSACWHQHVYMLRLLVLPVSYRELTRREPILPSTASFLEGTITQSSTEYTPSPNIQQGCTYVLIITSAYPKVTHYLISSHLYCTIHYSPTNRTTPRLLSPLCCRTKVTFSFQPCLSDPLDQANATSPCSSHNSPRCTNLRVITPTYIQWRPTLRFASRQANRQIAKQGHIFASLPLPQSSLPFLNIVQQCPRPL